VPAPRLQSEARTLGEAIRDYGVAYGVVIRPAALEDGEDEAKYFDIFDTGGNPCGIVDIHIVRDSVEICPKQDLHFPLFPDDEIVLGMLAC